MTNFFYLLLRITVGIMLLSYGLKDIGVLGGNNFTENLSIYYKLYGYPTWMTAAIILCRIIFGFTTMIGFFTKFSASILSGCMLLKLYQESLNLTHFSTSIVFDSLEYIYFPCLLIICLLVITTQGPGILGIDHKPTLPKRK